MLKRQPGLQLESLKAHHPHFLFNTSQQYLRHTSLDWKIPETRCLYPPLVRYAMRFILYDCQQKFRVPLEKDIGFLEELLYGDGEKRYPEAYIYMASIHHIFREDTGKKRLQPLMFIPFLENAFKHGSHRLTNSGYDHGQLEIQDHSAFYT